MPQTRRTNQSKSGFFGMVRLEGESFSDPAFWWHLRFLKTVPFFSSFWLGRLVQFWKLAKTKVCRLVFWLGGPVLYIRGVALLLEKVLHLSFFVFVGRNALNSHQSVDCGFG